METAKLTWLLIGTLGSTVSYTVLRNYSGKLEWKIFLGTILVFSPGAICIERPVLGTPIVPIPMFFFDNMISFPFHHWLSDGDFDYMLQSAGEILEDLRKALSLLFREIW